MIKLLEQVDNIKKSGSFQRESHRVKKNSHQVGKFGQNWTPIMSQSPFHLIEIMALDIVSNMQDD